jgi:hypothetical protein
MNKKSLVIVWDRAGGVDAISPILMPNLIHIEYEISWHTLDSRPQFLQIRRNLILGHFCAEHIHWFRFNRLDPRIAVSILVQWTVLDEDVIE